ncbi:MAG: substrate-binding domain-containing protein [Anaerolineaceae bacterium]|jgi:multiple sugar transport system substrate-binding protein
MNGKMINRRDFIKAAALIGGGAVFAACAPKEVIVTQQVVVTQQVEVTKEVQVTQQVTQEVTKEVQVTVPAPTAPVKLNFLNRGGQYIFDTMDMQMKLYQKTHPDVTFEINSVTSYSQQEELLMMLAAGVGPDCWFDSVRTTGMLAKKGVVEPIDSYLSVRSDFKEDNFVPFTFVCQTYDGKRWGIPWDSGAEVIMINKKLFNQAKIDVPTPDQWLTWDQIVQLGQKLTIDLDGKSADQPGFNPNRIKQFGFFPDEGHGRETYVWSNGGEIIAADMTMPIDTPEFTETMNWLADLGLDPKKLCGPNGKYQSSSMDIEPPSDDVAMYHDGVWDMGDYVSKGTDMAFIQVPYSKKKITYGQYSPLCVYTGSEHKDVAFDFIYFCTATADGQKILVDRGHLQPTLKVLRDDFLNGTPPPDKASRQLAYDVFENTDTFRWPGDTINSYWGAWYQYFIDLWTPYLTDLFNGKKRWEQIAPELRPKSEHLLQTGEVT